MDRFLDVLGTVSVSGALQVSFGSVEISFGSVVFFFTALVFLCAHPLPYMSVGEEHLLHVSFSSLPEPFIQKEASLTCLCIFYCQTSERSAFNL